jgi:hypothetical protein
MAELALNSAIKLEPEYNNGISENSNNMPIERPFPEQADNPAGDGMPISYQQFAEQDATVFFVYKRRLSTIIYIDIHFHIEGTGRITARTFVQHDNCR